MQSMQYLRDPFLWAFISLFALLASTQIVAGHFLGRRRPYGMAVVFLFALGRVVLVLPSIPQPRFEFGAWHWIIGGLLLLTGIVFAVPVFGIRPFTSPADDVRLRTAGLYGIVRNPLYLSEISWCLGWSLVWQSVIGVCLVPFWWLGLLFLSLLEEQGLERHWGAEYLEYKRQVRSRILPGLPL
jgi:protein-S-isoprenylcysteine O-methyltransferase Ste14